MILKISRFETPSCHAALKNQMHSEISTWFGEIAIPAVDILIEQYNQRLNTNPNTPGLQLSLERTSRPWPRITGFALEQNSQFPITVAGRDFTLRPLKSEDLSIVNATIKTIGRTRIEGKPVLLTPPENGIQIGSNLLTIQFSIQPHMKSWQ
ncbi:MAG: hypothetical protein ABII21_01000 [bacterium]